MSLGHRKPILGLTGLNLVILWLAAFVGLGALVVVASLGVAELRARANIVTPEAKSEFAQLSCIQRAIDRQTHPGETVVLRIDQAAEPYLFQRFIDLEVPRLTVTTGSARVSVSLLRVPTTEGNCSGVEVVVNRSS